jgi:hypothetical protein
MASTLAVFVFIRIAFNHWIRPHLITPLKAVTPLSLNTIGGFGSQNGSALNLFPGAPNIPNGWIYSTQIVDKAGHALTSQYLAKACPSLVALAGGNGPPPGLGGGGATSVHIKAPAGANTALQDCVVKLSSTFHQISSYQPGSRYWSFQWYELGIYLAGALVLSGLSIWWVRTRLS